MKENKNIFILIGPKGSGKSFIGDLFEKYFQIHFVRVENWAREVKKDRDPEDEDYIKEAFDTIEKGIVDLMCYYDAIVFESTGLSPHFDRMYDRLQSSYQVTLVKIVADKQLCQKRVRDRDQSIHIDVSDDLVEKINQEVLKKNIKSEFMIENTRATGEELVSNIEKIIRKTRVNR